MSHSIRSFEASELIIETTTFTPGHGAWSFMTLEGSIEVLEVDELTYHIRLNPLAVVMIYRHDEHGIRFARLYHNPEEPAPDAKREIVNRAAIVTVKA